MAKSAKYTVDFFPHDCTHKMTIYILEQKFGNDGYAFWFKLLETLGASKGHYIDFNKDNFVQFISAKAHITIEKCQAIIDELASLDAIDSDLWKHKIIWSQNFIERLSHVYSDRRCPLPNKPNIENNNGSTIITQDLHGYTPDYSVIRSNTDISDELRSNTSNLHTKGKESKGKERKGKDIYAPQVLLSSVEYSKLVDEFGEDLTKQKIEKLSLYKQSSGKSYKSDYATILNWDRKDKEQKKSAVEGKPLKRYG